MTTTSPHPETTAPPAGSEESGTTKPDDGRRWWMGLIALATLGLGVRVSWVASTPKLSLGGDAEVYHYGANLLASGHGFIEPLRYMQSGVASPSAYHPPMWILYLAAFSVVGLKSWLTHRLAGCLIGAASIILIGLLGREVGGRRVGLLAAGAAAVYPLIWINDGVGMSESMAIFTCAGALLMAYRVAGRPTPLRAATLGLFCGMAALTRPEQSLLAVVVAAPVILLLRQQSLRERLSLLAICAVATLGLVAPWVGFNMVRFDHPVTMSTNLEPTLVVSNCPPTFDRHSGFYAFWDMKCLPDSSELTGDESNQDVRLRHIATTFLDEHKRQLPGVVLARMGRLWNLYRPVQQTHFDQLEGRPLWVSQWGLFGFIVLIPLAVGGAVVLRRRRRLLFPLLAIPVIVTATVALTFANTRYRSPAEIAVVVLAAVAVDEWARRSATTHPNPSAVDENADPPPSGAADSGLHLEDRAAPGPPGDRRDDRGRPRFPCFDGYRAIAALFVLGVHVTFISGFTARHRGVGTYTSRLDIGVSVFFLISGFLLYRPFVAAHLARREGPRLRPYLWRRALRILPAYWVALTIVVFVLHDYSRDSPGIHSLKDAVIYYGLLQIYSGHYLGGGIQQAWSLCSEVSFYLFLPLWAAMMKLATGRRSPAAGISADASVASTVRVELAGVATLYVGSLVFRALLVTTFFQHHIADIAALDWLPSVLDLFALGMALAIVSAWASQRRQPSPFIAFLGDVPWLWWGLAAVTYWAVATQIGLHLDFQRLTTAEWIGREILYGWFALFLLLPGIFGPQDRGFIRDLLQRRAVVLLGLISYGIYIWHNTAIDEYRKHRHLAPFTGNFWAMLSFTVVVSLIVATLSYLLIEKPVLRYKDRPLSLGRRRPPPSPVKAPEADIADASAKR